MTKTLKTVAAAAALALAGTASSAALIDFTDDTTGTSGFINGVKWELTVVPDKLDQSEDGPGNIGVLKGDNDGVGIRDDEITAPRQYAQLAFTQDGKARDVTITGVYWLDLFFKSDKSSFETGNIGLGSGIGTAEDSFVAQQKDSKPFGYGAFKTGVTGSVFSFWVDETNDSFGSPDAALAGVSIAPIPLPAGVFLLGGALAGLGVARRRRKS